VIFERSGHYPFAEEAEGFAEVVREFRFGLATWSGRPPLTSRQVEAVHRPAEEGRKGCPQDVRNQ
jgi:hypothetical protein